MLFRVAGCIAATHSHFFAASVATSASNMAACVRLSLPPNVTAYKATVACFTVAAWRAACAFLRASDLVIL